jgi:hypothetical protein
MKVHFPGERFVEPIKLPSLVELYPELFDDMPELKADLAKRRAAKAANLAVFPSKAIAPKLLNAAKPQKTALENAQP